MYASRATLPCEPVNTQQKKSVCVGQISDGLFDSFAIAAGMFAGR